MVEDAFRLLYNEEFPGWLYEVNLGATTIWERWNSMLPNGSVSGTGMNSFNHYSYGSVCEAIYSKIAGLGCGEPEWKTAVIEPHFNYRMKKMDMKFKSPAGIYEIHWQILEDGSVDVKAGIPKGTKAQIILPGMEILSVEAGEHHWHCKANASLVAPFSVNTPLIDLLHHPVSKGVMQQTMPELCNEEVNEMFPYSLLEIKENVPTLADADLQPLNKILEQIKV